MELEQILKQLDWLDDERRKDKTRLGALEEHLAALEGSISPISSQVKDLSGEITRLNSMSARMDSYDDSLRQMRLETKVQVEELEKSSKKRAEETEKMRRAELHSVDVSLAELRKEIEQITELKRSMQARIEGETRLARLVDETRNRIETIRRGEEEYTRTIRLLDDGRRQDAKRLTDLSGEVAAMRKRIDDNRGKIELAAATLKKVETRANELAVVEAERRESMTGFIESQALKEVERERVWKEWQARFQTIEAQTADVENMLQNLDATNRSVKRSQQVMDELSQKVERRTNEITEIQRLAEERFRQEWVTFKADDQKRWTNYTLTMDEQRNEAQRQYERLVEKVTQLEDTMQEIQDLLGQANEHTEKRLQTLLALVHEWVSSYERSVGRTRG
jgi:chromosome segregation ATPase